MKTLLKIAALAAVLSGSAVAQEPPSEPVVVVHAGRLVDPASGRVLENQLIVIRGERIEAVGSAASMTVPADARQIDLSNHTVLPESGALRPPRPRSTA